MDAEQPLAPASGGRDVQGRFAVGNRIGTGNPQARRVQRLRAELLRAVDPPTLRKVIDALIAQAVAGDVTAIKELLDRCLGRATEGADLVEKVELIERLILERRTVNRG